MAITTAGLNYLAGLVTGTGTAFNNANAKLGVGDGTTAFAVAQTDLQGTNKVRKAMDTGYPTASGATMTFKSTYLPAEANFTWNEWGVFNAATGGTMLCRLVENNSTKLSNQTWILEATVTFVTA